MYKSIVKGFFNLSLKTLPIIQPSAHTRTLHLTPIVLNDTDFKKYAELKNSKKIKLTAWNCYYSKNSLILKAENPKLHAIDLMKSCALSWKNLSAEEKQVYEKRAKELMTTQEPLTDFIKKLTTEQLEDYKKKYQVLCSEKQKKDTYRQLRKEEKAHNKPIRPSNVFILFGQDNYEKLNDKKSVVNAQRELAAKWKDLPESEKKAYKTKAEDAFQKYIADIKAWKEKMINEGNAKLIKRGARNIVRKKIVKEMIAKIQKKATTI